MIGGPRASLVMDGSALTDASGGAFMNGGVGLLMGCGVFINGGVSHLMDSDLIQNPS